MSRQTMSRQTIEEVLAGLSGPITAITGFAQPDETFGTWAEYLATCDLRDQCRGVRYFGHENCSFLLFPTGDLLQNYGYQGQGLMNTIFHAGWEELLEMIKTQLANPRGRRYAEENHGQSVEIQIARRNAGK